jgi:hypothetical protein
MRRSPYAKEHPHNDDDYDYNESFLKQNVNLSNYMFLPDGWEPVVLFFYLGLLPYIAGLLFIYLFIAEGHFDSFLQLDLFTIIPVWSIGYETLAGLLLLNIIYSALTFQVRKRARRARHEQNNGQKQNHYGASADELLEHYKQNR